MEFNTVEVEIFVTFNAFFARLCVFLVTQTNKKIMANNFCMPKFHVCRIGKIANIFIRKFFYLYSMGNYSFLRNSSWYGMNKLFSRAKWNQTAKLTDLYPNVGKN